MKDASAVAATREIEIATVKYSEEIICRVLEISLCSCLSIWLMHTCVGCYNATLRGQNFTASPHPHQRPHHVVATCKPTPIQIRLCDAQFALSCSPRNALRPPRHLTSTLLPSFHTHTTHPSHSSNQYLPTRRIHVPTYSPCSRLRNPISRHTCPQALARLGIVIDFSTSHGDRPQHIFSLPGDA
jgi:hypothetical protein